MRTIGHPRSHGPVHRHPRPRITLDQLHTFVAVADTEHVSGAADALQLSQGSVSAAVSRLEEALGLPLLHRVGRNVRLTDVGRAVRQLGTQVLEHVASIEDMASGYLAVERGEVTLAAGRVAGAHQVPRWLGPFVAAHPEVDVRISLAPLRAVLDLLHDGGADIVIVSADVKLPGVEAMVLERSELVVVAAAQHPLAASRHAWRELPDHRYLAHERGTGTRRHAERVVGGEDRLHAVIELEEGALHAALLAGIGYAVMPRSAVEVDIALGHVVVLPHAGRAVTQPVTAARRVSVHTPAAEELWRHLAALGAASRGSTSKPPIA